LASHLSVTTAANGIPATRALNGTTSEAGTAPEIFASLLGTDVASAADQTPTMPIDPVLGNLLGLQLDGEQDQEEPALDPLALPVIDTLPSVPTALPGEMAEELAGIVEDLAAIKSDLNAGKPIDSDLLDRLDERLNELADALGLDLSGPSSSLSALAKAAASDETDPLDQLTKVLSPAVASLAEKAAAESSAKDQQAARLELLANKLTALLSGLNGGEISGEQLAALGLDKAGADNTGLQEALAKLTAGADQTPAEPALGAPQLKITEPVLSGSESSSEPEGVTGLKAGEVNSAHARDQDGGQSEDPGTDKSDGKPKSEAKATAAGPAPADKMPESAPTPAQQAARVDASAAPRPVQTGYQTSQQQLNLPLLAFELVRQVNDGNTRFQIRLDPPELGKIEVKLDIDPSGQVNARMVVEKAETLDLMQRDQRGLERALQQAGLDGAKTNLEFSLKENPFTGGGQQHSRDAQEGSSFGNARTDAGEEPPPTITLYRGSRAAGGVNIMA
jgi:flagellar hook-length control protein FliK